jgi:hypothetical protein
MVLLPLRLHLFPLLDHRTQEGIRHGFVATFPVMGIPLCFFLDGKSGTVNGRLKLPVESGTGFLPLA